GRAPVPLHRAGAAHLCPHPRRRDRRGRPAGAPLAAGPATAVARPAVVLPDRLGAAGLRLRLGDDHRQLGGAGHGGALPGHRVPVRVRWRPTAAAPDLTAARRAMPSHHLYVHVPFCRLVCAYCDFVTVGGRAADIPRYVGALHAELTLRPAPGDLLTVYFG